MSKKTWKELKREHLGEDEVERIRYEAAMELAEVGLGELRQRLGVTQAELAARMESAQPHLSKIENSEDYYISTLKRYIEALGGHIEIRAVFSDDEGTDDEVALRV